MAIRGSSIIPSARYRDAHAAIEWLCRVFGFSQHVVYEGPDGSVAHAELTLGDGMFMLGTEGDRGEFARYMTTLNETGGRETLGLCIVVEDCKAVYERAQTANADIVIELNQPEYGGESFMCRDCEGHIWWVGSYDPWAGKNEEKTA